MITKSEVEDISSVEVGFVKASPTGDDPQPGELVEPLQDKRLPLVTRLGRRHKAFPALVRADQFISVDVFDTLLYRKPLSERRRFFLEATAFLRMCSQHSKPTVSSVCAARSEANRWAYHSIDTLDHDSEVRLADVFLHQLQILGLSKDFLPLLMAAEVEVEKTVLTPNKSLIEWLSFQRSRKIRVVAISDTSMPGICLQEIIDTVVGHEVIDHLYTSADIGLSKRYGGIFAAVALLEGKLVSQQIHLGDDETADVVRARAAGVSAVHLPRSRSFIARRKADGASFQLASWAMNARPSAKDESFPPLKKGDAQAFGRRVLGPIFGLYCMRLWLYLSFANRSEGGAVALFCARGGLQLRSVFEAFLERTGLPLDTRREDLMISRVVAVRAALLQKSSSAFDEIGREFPGTTMATIACAIAQMDIHFEPQWDAPFDPTVFASLMDSTFAGQKFQSRLVEQNDLFLAHLQSLAAGKGRLILCDTGLYGSTLRMLQGGISERHWECLLFARSNYKGFASDHFVKTRGIISEQDHYNPTVGSSTVLRYWQLFEHIFEPDLQSVKIFALGVRSAVTSNLQTSGWREHMSATRSALLQGILDYLAELPKEGWFEQLCRDEPKSWRDLRKSMLFPDVNDLLILSTGERSHDFGRDDKYKTIPQTKKSTLIQKLLTLRSTRWKEGFVTQEFGFMRPFIHIGIESLYFLRWLASVRS